MSGPTIYLEIDGKPIAAADCQWLLIAPCGCICGVSMAASGDEVHLTGEDAFNWDTPKVVRDRDKKLGFTHMLVSKEQYRTDWYEKMKAGCKCTPEWGVDPIPVPEGWTWMTTDGNFGRRTYRKHIVPNGSEVHVYGQAKVEALCGKKEALWFDKNHLVSDTIPCAKCEKRARDTSPVLVPVGGVTDVAVAGEVL